MVVGGKLGEVGSEAANLGDPLLHASSRQTSLGVVIPALLRRLADLSQALWAGPPPQQEKKKKTQEERGVINTTSLFSESSSFSVA